MSDQQSRGGKKAGGNNPQTPDEHQTAHAGQPRPESTKPSKQGKKAMDRQGDDDAAEPDESDEPTGNKKKS